jgi:hypothetical protein
VFYHTLWMNSVLVLRRRRRLSSNQSVEDMVGSIGMRRGFINRGDWLDGLERQGSNPWPTTIQSRISLGVKRHVANVQSPV